MNARPTSRRWALAAGLVVLSGGAAVTGIALGSDHQDTPFVELNPKSDLTDVYAFPGSAAGRIVLVMDTRGFLTPAGAQDPDQGSFDHNLLYQSKSIAAMAVYVRGAFHLSDRSHCFGGDGAKALP